MRAGSADIEVSPATLLPRADNVALTDDFIIVHDGVLKLASSAAFVVSAIRNAPVYADEAAAVAGGLSPYTLYRTATGELRYKLPGGGVFSRTFSKTFN